MNNFEIIELPTLPEHRIIESDIQEIVERPEPDLEILVRFEPEHAFGQDKSLENEVEFFETPQAKEIREAVEWARMEPTEKPSYEIDQMTREVERLRYDQEAEIGKIASGMAPKGIETEKSYYENYMNPENKRQKDQEEFAKFKRSKNW